LNFKRQHLIFRGFILYGTLVTTIFAGCNPNQNGAFKKITPSEDEALATNYIALLRQSNFGPILANTDPSLKTALTTETLVRMAKAIPPQAPVSVKIVGVQQYRERNLFNDRELSRINLSFEYQFPTNWIVISVATQKKDGISTIIGFHVNLLSDSLENLNKFTFSGKTALQYGTITLGILIPIFILCVLVLCIRTKMEKKKWLWVIFILFGVGKFTVNWTNNHLGFSLLYISLLGSGAFAAPYGPWLISISLPLGAIAFLLRRKRLITQATPLQIPGTEPFSTLD
jgi:hypothetical protein